MSKRGQVKMSFGMIFSIILIIVFIAFAFYGITKFVSLQKSITSDQFVSNLQDEVTKAFNSAQTSVQKSYNLPDSVSKVCFTNSASDNLIFIDTNGNHKVAGNIEHINLEIMGVTGRDLCFNRTDGKIDLTIQKNFGDNLVIIS